MTTLQQLTQRRVLWFAGVVIFMLLLSIESVFKVTTEEVCSVEQGRQRLEYVATCVDKNDTFRFECVKQAEALIACEEKVVKENQ